MKIIQRPYHLLLVTALALLIGSFIDWDQTIDIHLHDTYYVLPAPFMYWQGVIIAVLLWVVYHLTHGILLNKALTWVHIIVTLISPFLIRIWYDRFFETYSAMPTYYIEGSSYAGASANYTIIILTIFMIAQGLFLVNLMGGGVRALLRKQQP